MYFQAGEFLTSAQYNSVRWAGVVQSLVFRDGFEKRNLQGVVARRVAPAGWPGSAISDVHRDFKAKAHVAGGGFFPFHAVSPVGGYPARRGPRYAQRIRPYKNSMLGFNGLRYRKTMGRYP